MEPTQGVKMHEEQREENLSTKSSTHPDWISLPTLPIQLQCLTRPDKDPHIFNMAFLSITQAPLDPEKLRMALFHVIAHHEALRLRFQNTPSGWKTYIAKDNGAIPFSVVDLSTLEIDKQSSAIETVSEQLQGTLNLSHGPLIKLVYFDLGENQSHRLLFIIHHFIFDSFSWSLLLNDFFIAYKQLQQNEVVQLPPTSTSLKEYAESLVAYAQSPALLEELDYWTTEPRMHILPLPMDYPEGVKHTAVYGEVKGRLSEKETNLLLALAKYRITIHDILLTALYKTYECWTKEEITLVELVNHGRLPLFENMDFIRSMGYFNFHFPFVLDGREKQNPRELALSISEQFRHIPKGGVGYGILRYLSDTDIQQRLSQFSSPQWLLNYHGRLLKKPGNNDPLTQAKEQVRNTSSQQRIEPMYVFIDGIINKQHLHLNMLYQKNIYKQTTIELLMQYFLESLREIPLHFQL